MDMQLATAEPMRFQPQLGRSVTIDEAARRLGVSRRTVYYWIRDLRLRTIRTLGGSLRVVTDSMHDLSKSTKHMTGELA